MISAKYKIHSFYLPYFKQSEQPRNEGDVIYVLLIAAVNIKYKIHSFCLRKKKQSEHRIKKNHQRNASKKDNNCEIENIIYIFLKKHQTTK